MTQIANVFIGNQQAERVYLGENLVWERELMPQPYNPISLFANNEWGFWYDHSDLSTMFQDVAMTIPVTADNQRVAIVLDKSGNNNHLIQYDISKRPVYRTDGVLHSMDYSAGDNYFTCNNPIPLTPEDRVFSVGIKHNTRNPNNFGSHIIESYGSDNYVYLNLSMGIFEQINFIATYTHLKHAYVKNYDYSNKNVVLTSITLANDLLFNSNGALLNMEIGDRPSGFTANNGYRVGSSRNIGERVFNGKMYGMVFVLKSMSNQEINELEAFLAEKSGAIIN